MTEPRDPATERMSHNIGEPSGVHHTGARSGEHSGRVVTSPTTDEHGERTASPQNKIVAVLTSAAGVTVIGGLITALTGLEIDPTVLVSSMGGITALVATLVGYLVPNRTDAN